MASVGRNRGFTLIELMIVVVVVAILAAIAYPSYQNYIKKSKRADAHAALLRVQLEQEKWRVNNPEYTDDLADLGLTAQSPDGHYTIAIVAGSAGSTGFTATATGLGTQASDTGCTTPTPITLQLNGGVDIRTPDQCW